jgi:hypothetical protein
MFTNTGAPITIDWIPQGEKQFSINAYEQFKPSRKRRNRLYISVSDRATMLLAAGYTMHEINDAMISSMID